jgi:Plasmid pRiA4b ORF-3-like protein
MSSTEQARQLYQLRIWIREINPQIWRRLLVRNDSTIAQLHDTLQIAFGWTDQHLHQFLIRGKPYGVRIKRPLLRMSKKRPAWSEVHSRPKRLGYGFLKPNRCSLASST